MTSDEFEVIIKKYKDFDICIDVKRMIPDEELVKMSYPYPIETVDSILISPIGDACELNYPIRYIRGIPLDKIEICDVGYSDKCVKLETFINIEL